MKVYKEFIRLHLPEELVDKADYNFDYYFLDGMNVMTEGERGGDDVLVYKAKSEEDLMLWQYSEVCRFIGDWPEFDKRMGYPKTWRYYRAYAEDNLWKYIEYKKYDYNAIEDSRLHSFEQYLALVKIGFPPDRWEKEVKIHIDLMNYLKKRLYSVVFGFINKQIYNYDLHDYTKPKSRLYCYYSRI